MKARLTYAMTTLGATLCAGLLIFGAPARAAPAEPPMALVVADAVALRAAPRDAAGQQALLWQGELVELRGRRMEYLQVWDHQRERGGYVKATQLRPVVLDAAHAAELLAVQRFLKDSPGSEGLTFAYSAAWLKAASAAEASGPLGAEVLDGIAVAADRLARRATAGGLSKGAQEAVLGQLDAAKRYGIQFLSVEREGRMQICYDGELFKQLLGLPTASPEQRARAVLGLARSECEDPDLSLPARAMRQQGLAELLDKVSDTGLEPVLKNRLNLKRANVWSTVAFDRARQAPGTASQQAAQRAIEALAKVQLQELPDEDQATMNEAVMRVSASRWAALPAPVPPSKGIGLRSVAGSEPGQTCISLVDGQAGSAPLLSQCSHGLVWPASFSLNREATAATLAVQNQAGWSELWVMRKSAGRWTLDVLPPAASQPGLGYAELAGWVPGGQQMLVVREARGEGKYQRRFELMDIATLSAQRSAGDPGLLGAFQRWPSPLWKQQTVSLR